MGKRKGNAKVKDTSHSRKHSHGASAISTSSQSGQPQTLSSSSFRNSNDPADDPTLESTTSSGDRHYIYLAFRIVYVFVTKYLPYIFYAYVALAVVALAWELSQGKRRLELKPILRFRQKNPSALLRQFRTGIYDLVFFRPQTLTRYFSMSQQNELFVDNANKRTLLFAALREAIVREPGGYVHPDLGILQPAPSGAVRGIGMVKDSYHKCQTGCFPGNDKEERLHNSTRYKQQDILIRVPLAFQMTRKVAVETIVPLLPSPDKAAAMADLDDPTLLVMLLAHERTKKRFSRWHPYIASLPPQPTCGYWRESRPEILRSLAQYRSRYEMDADGWEDELYKATEYSEAIVRQLVADYGPYLFKDTKDTTRMFRRIAWALCQVASRATAGYGDHGSLRLIPMLDMINHDIHAGGFLELTGKETIETGDPLNASLDDEGTFIVRSLRHGRRKPLKVGQELLVNYNVPNYSPLDWFVSLGFVPAERRSPWIKVDPVLPPLRNEGPGVAEGDSIPSEQSIQNKEKFIEAKLKELNL